MPFPLAKVPQNWLKDIFVGKRKEYQENASF